MLHQLYLIHAISPLTFSAAGSGLLLDVCKYKNRMLHLLYLTVALKGQFTIGFCRFNRHFDDSIINFTIRTSVLTVVNQDFVDSILILTIGEPGFCRFNLDFDDLNHS